MCTSRGSLLVTLNTALNILPAINIGYLLVSFMVDDDTAVIMSWSEAREGRKEKNGVAKVDTDGPPSRGQR